MADLALVPVQELLNEVRARTKVFVCAYTISEDVGSDKIYVNHVGDSYLSALGLCEVLKDSIIERHDNGEQ